MDNNERRATINREPIISDFLRRKKKTVYLVLLLLGAGILFFLFTRYYPQEYYNLKVYLFTNDVYYRVDGKSMLPTFQDQQMWYGTRCLDSLCRNSIQRGDIIVFETRNVTGRDETFIKRVIGIPLDYITITDGKVYLNNELLIEPYISTATVTNTSNECQRYDLGADEVFVLGDNRTHSNDSRTLGPIAIAEIWGISRFAKYNSIESRPMLDLDVTLQITEKECPVWIKD